jgi:hypothetical protein
MKPSELYVRPSQFIEPWYDRYSHIVGEVLQIDDLNDYEDYRHLKETDPGHFQVHQKFYHNVDGERGVGIYALYFEGKPFAYAMTGGRGGQDAREQFVTDEETWHIARAYAIEALHKTPKIQHKIVSPDADKIHGFYGTFIAEFGDELRLVDVDNVNPLTGTAVYDMEKFTAYFDRVCRPLGNEVDYREGLKEPRMLEAGIAAFRAGVLGDRVDVDIEMSDTSRLVAVSVVEGQTFAHAISGYGNYFTWAREITPKMIGPASLAECYAEYAAGREIDPDCAYIREAAAVFGADPILIQKEVTDYIVTGSRPLAERIVNLLPRHTAIPASIKHGVEIYTLGHLIVDNPSVQRFCQGGYPDLKAAQELVSKAKEVAAEEQLEASLAP